MHYTRKRIIEIIKVFFNNETALSLINSFQYSLSNGYGTSNTVDEINFQILHLVTRIEKLPVPSSPMEAKEFRRQCLHNFHTLHINTALLFLLSFLGSQPKKFFIFAFNEQTSEIIHRFPPTLCMTCTYPSLK